MANVKITDLVAYTDPASTDVLPIVDVGGDTTKKVSVATLLKNASAGTAAAPGIAFDGDANTGVYSPGADQFAISTGGTGRLFIDSSGRVGIGTSNVLGILHAKATTNGNFHIRTLSDVGGSGEGFAIDSLNDAQNSVRPIGFRAATYSFFGPGTTYATLNSTGLGIGTTSPGNNLTVVSSSTTGVLSLGDSSDGDYMRMKTQSVLGNAYLEADGELTFDRTTTSSASIIFKKNGTEQARLDNSGRLLVGTNSARGTAGNATTATVQIETANNTAALQIIANPTSAFGPALFFGKSRGNAIGSNTAVENNDVLGGILFSGADGTDLNTIGAAIEARVDGTPGVDDLPTRLVFFTTADGASSPTERLRISQSGDIGISSCPAVKPVTDNATLLGVSGGRWSAVWAANGTIQTSDQRAKTDINDASLGIDFIKLLRPVSYRWIEGGKRDTGERDENNNYIYESVPGTRTHWGFIAQEVKEVVDTAGVDFGGWVLSDKDDPDSQQALRYDQFIAPLTKALQEALEKIETLEAKVAALEAA